MRAEKRQEICHDRKHGQPALQGRPEPRGPVLDLARRPGERARLGGRGRDGLAGGVPRADRGAVDRHAAAQRPRGDGGVRVAVSTTLGERLARLSPEKRALLEHRLRAATEATPDRIPRRAGGGEAPLSFAQRRLWFVDQLEPQNVAYNSPLALIVNGRIDVPAFARSLNEIVRRHEALRTTFEARSGEPVQVVHEHADLPLPVVDLERLDEAERLAEARRLAVEEARRPFDLAAGPLVRAQLLRLAEDRHVFLLTLHHVVTDGWSMRILFRELQALYPAFARGEGSPLEDPPVQYADFAAWQRERLQGERLERDLAYWRERLAGAPTLDLPTDRPRPPVASHRGAFVRVSLPDELAEGLARLSREAGTTLFMTLLAAFKTLLARATGQEDVVVGSSVAGRSHADVEGLIGFFVNTLVLRTDLSGSPTFRDVLARVRETCLGAYAHQELPFERVVEELAPERDPSRTPLFQVLFQGGEQASERWSVAELDFDWFDVDNRTAKFDLLFDLRDIEEGLRGEVEYNTDLFDEATIERLLGHYRVLLEAVLADPDRPISRLPLLTEAERRRLLHDWNGTETPFPSAATLHALFEQQAAVQPEAAAVLAGERELSYGELDRRANRLARRPRPHGVVPTLPVD